VNESEQLKPGEFGAGCDERIVDRASIVAFAVYLAFSLSIFRGALAFNKAYVGIGPDPSLSMWFLAWWPFAISHHAGPFFTDLIWVPQGINLAWTTLIPLPSLTVSPITASLGPVASFNLLCFAGPPLSAWSAFLLCRYICRSFWASMLGGYIFGFSAYVLQKQTCGQLDLTLVFLQPLAVLLVVRAIIGGISRAKFIGWTVLLLVAQFLICIEVFATMSVFGAMALLLGWSFAPPQARAHITRILPDLFVAYAISAILLSPYLYSMFGKGLPGGAFWTPESFSADLWNFVVPSTATQLGITAMFTRMSANFASGACEANAYIGLPLILITASYAWNHWRRDPVGKLLVDSLIIVCVLAMGPIIHAGGVGIMQGPAKILTRLPLLDRVLPARLMVYAFLIVAIVTSLWLVDNQLSTVSRTAIGAIVMISLVPNLSSEHWITAIDTPEFFRTNLYRHYIKPQENLLILPYGVRGNSMLWQAETNMYFKLVGGYSGPSIPEYNEWLIVNAFMNPSYIPNARAQLVAFMANHDVSTIAVVDDDPDSEAWHQLASSCCTLMARAGGVSLYQAAPKELAAYKSSSATQLEQDADSVLFDRLLLAAVRLLAGNDLAGLRPRQAQVLGLLPASWITGPTGTGSAIVDNPVDDSDGRYRYGAWLGAMENGRIGVGVYGSYAALEPLIERYRRSAAQVYFPYPRRLDQHALTDKRGLMVLEFDRADLESAERHSESKE
jgi:hypothetical protein